MIQDLLGFMDGLGIGRSRQREALSLRTPDLEDAMHVSADALFGAQWGGNRNLHDSRSSPNNAIQTAAQLSLLSFP